MRTRRWRGGLGAFLALQVLFLLALNFSLLSIRPLAQAAPRPSAGSHGDAGDVARPGESGSGRAADPLADRKPVTLAFAGDVHFEDFLGTRLRAEGPAMLAPLGAMLSGADLSLVNLETAITERGVADYKEFTFRAPATALWALQAAGVSAVSMANNHGLDYGTEGLADSLAASADTGLPVLGIGRDSADAYRPWVATVRGQRVAVVAATQVLDDARAWTATSNHAGLASAKDVPRLVAAVRSARAMADTVVVFLHWGVEGQTCPSGDQSSLADSLVQAGADVIVGGHAHRLQGAGMKDGAFIAYGLGNAVFYSMGGPSTESGVLKVTVDGRHVLGYAFTPARLVNGVATALTGEASQRAQERWTTLRDCTGLQP